MYWSSYDSDTNIQIIADSGFEIESAIVETSTDPTGGTESHLWVVARA